MNQSNQSPVYLMMPKEDLYDITLVAVMDLFLKSFIDRNRARNKKSRVWWYEKLHKLLMTIEGSYVGSLPDEMVNKAEKFNKLISADLNAMLKLAKQ